MLSVQVLNEFASVASRKLAMSTSEVRGLATVRAVCTVVPISEETQDLGLRIAERYDMSMYDAMRVASVRLAGCDELLSEDLQDGRLERRVIVRNPLCGTRS